MNSIPYLVGWNHSHDMIQDEAKQLVEEGRDAGWIQTLLQPAGKESPDATLLEKLQAAPMRPDFPFHEPSDLEGIRTARGPGIRSQPVNFSDDVLLDRMEAAWIGRCCGCALGKPVETFMGSHGALSSKDRIKIYLQGVETGEYPLRDYFPGTSPSQEQTGPTQCPLSTRERISFMESDDDIRYTVINQKTLLTKGLSFTTGDVMASWMNSLYYGQVCTAETQAYRNFILRFHVRYNQDPEVDWVWVATHQNPYREWIGAQIRADSWGYAAPGNPELAAELAWRDARMSHIKNGIYGEMFVAAMIAVAFVMDDPFEVVEAGLAEIPETSRLHADIRQTLEVCREHGCKGEAFEVVLNRLYQLFGHYHPVHTNNNAALVVAALLLGAGDFEKAITIAVMGGWDTDCNGATVGSIFGAMHGMKSIPEKWKAPLHDTLYSEIIGYHPISIRECARRSLEIVQKGRAHAPV